MSQTCAVALACCKDDETKLLAACTGNTYIVARQGMQINTKMYDVVDLIRLDKLKVKVKENTKTSGI